MLQYFIPISDRCRGRYGGQRRQRGDLHCCQSVWTIQANRQSGPPGTRRDTHLLRVWRGQVPINVFLSTAQCYQTQSLSGILPLLLCHVSRLSEGNQLCIKSDVNVFAGVPLSCFPSPRLRPAVGPRGVNDRSLDTTMLSSLSKYLVACRYFGDTGFPWEE